MGSRVDGRWHVQLPRHLGIHVSSWAQAGERPTWGWLLMVTQRHSPGVLRRDLRERDLQGELRQEDRVEGTVLGSAPGPAGWAPGGCHHEAWHMQTPVKNAW